MMVPQACPAEVSVCTTHVHMYFEVPAAVESHAKKTMVPQAHQLDCDVRLSYVCAKFCQELSATKNHPEKTVVPEAFAIESASFSHSVGKTFSGAIRDRKPSREGSCPRGSPIRVHGVHASFPCVCKCFQELYATGSRPEKTVVPQAHQLDFKRVFPKHACAPFLEELLATGQHPEKTEVPQACEIACNKCFPMRAHHLLRSYWRQEAIQRRQRSCRLVRLRAINVFPCACTIFSGAIGDRKQSREDRGPAGL